MSFLRSYLSYATLNEAPDMWHVWGGYTALATAVGRRVWLPYGSDNIYPNLYVLYVGNAGAGKSYAMRHAVWLMEKVINPGMLSYDVETPEGLLQHMAGLNPKVGSECMVKMKWPDGVERETHQLTIVANEFVDFIRTNPEGWTGFLNNVYDKDPYKYRTKNQGTSLLVGPYVSLLGAIPTDVSKDLQRQQLINTGFARRCIMQYGVRKYDNPYPFPVWEQPQIVARDFCVSWLKRVRTLNGPMVPTPAARKWWIDWYTDHSVTLRKRATPYTESWLSSKPTQVTKIAMLSALSERCELTLIPQDYEIAIAYLNQMETGLYMIFGGVGRNELAAVSIKILEYLKQQKAPVPVPTLERQFFSSLTPGKGFQELSEMLRYLEQTDQVYKFDVAYKGIQTAYYIIRESVLDWFDSADAALVSATLPDSLRAVLLAERQQAEQAERKNYSPAEIAPTPASTSSETSTESPH